MKVLLVGDWHSRIHEEACGAALVELGCEVMPFAWHGYFGEYRYDDMPRAAALASRIQHGLVGGPAVWRLNRDLVSAARASRPDLVFFYRPTHVWRRTVVRVKEAAPHATLAAFTNDDPFSTRAPRRLWRHLLRSMPCYDVHFVYRSHNLEEFRAAGARRVELLRSFFVPAVHRPLALPADERPAFESDVAFVGHYEPDGRVDVLGAAADGPWRFKLFGPGWDDPRATALARRAGPVRAVWGDEYAKALCATKIALCLLSRLNRDTYTRRCFEIPATGTFMLSEHSADLAMLFQEGVEAEFFRSCEELVDKIRYYLANEGPRRRIADAGRRAVWRDGHDVVSRMRQMLAAVGRWDDAPASQAPPAAASANR